MYFVLIDFQLQNYKLHCSQLWWRMFPSLYNLQLQKSSTSHLSSCEWNPDSLYCTCYSSQNAQFFILWGCCWNVTHSFISKEFRIFKTPSWLRNAHLQGLFSGAFNNGALLRAGTVRSLRSWWSTSLEDFRNTSDSRMRSSPLYSTFLFPVQRALAPIQLMSHHHLTEKSKQWVKCLDSLHNLAICFREIHLQFTCKGVKK